MNAAGTCLQKCQMCAVHFNDIPSLQLHSHVVGVPGHPCERCGKLYSNMQSLNQHVETHEDPKTRKKFPCDWCGKKFMNKYWVRKHMASKLCLQPKTKHKRRTKAGIIRRKKQRMANLERHIRDIKERKVAVLSAARQKEILDHTKGKFWCTDADSSVKNRSKEESRTRRVAFDHNTDTILKYLTGNKGETDTPVQSQVINSHDPSNIGSKVQSGTNTLQISSNWKTSDNAHVSKSKDDAMAIMVKETIVRSTSPGLRFGAVHSNKQSDDQPPMGLDQIPDEHLSPEERKRKEYLIFLINLLLQKQAKKTFGTKVKTLINIAKNKSWASEATEQIPVSSQQIPVTNQQISVTNQHITIANQQVPITNPQITVTNQQVPITNPQITVTNQQVPITNPQITVTNRQVPIINPQITVTNRQVPITNPQITVTNREIPGTVVQEHGVSLLENSLNIANRIAASRLAFERATKMSKTDDPVFVLNINKTQDVSQPNAVGHSKQGVNIERISGGLRKIQPAPAMVDGTNIVYQENQPSFPRVLNIAPIVTKTTSHTVSVLPPCKINIPPEPVKKRRKKQKPVAISPKRRKYREIAPKPIAVVQPELVVNLSGSHDGGDNTVDSGTDMESDTKVPTGITYAVDNQPGVTVTVLHTPKMHNKLKLEAEKNKSKLKNDAVDKQDGFKVVPVLRKDGSVSKRVYDSSSAAFVKKTDREVRSQVFDGDTLKLKTESADGKYLSFFANKLKMAELVPVKKDSDANQMTKPSKVPAFSFDKNVQLCENDMPPQNDGPETLVISSLEDLKYVNPEFAGPPKNAGVTVTPVLLDSPFGSMNSDNRKDVVLSSVTSPWKPKIESNIQKEVHMMSETKPTFHTEDSASCDYLKNETNLASSELFKMSHISCAEFGSDAAIDNTERYARNSSSEKSKSKNPSESLTTSFGEAIGSETVTIKTEDSPQQRESLPNKYQRSPVKSSDIDNSNLSTASQGELLEILQNLLKDIPKQSPTKSPGNANTTFSPIKNLTEEIDLSSALSGVIESHLKTSPNKYIIDASPKKSTSDGKGSGPNGSENPRPQISGPDVLDENTMDKIVRVVEDLRALSNANQTSLLNN